MYERWLENFLRSYDIYTQNNMLAAHSYSNDLDDNIYIKDNIDLDNQKALERYNKFIKLIISRNPIEYKIDKFEQISEKECIDTFKEIIYKIFINNSEIDNIIYNFIDNIIITDRDEPLNGQVVQMLNTETNEIKYKVRIPNIKNTGGIVCLSHEFMHYYSCINNLDYNKKMYYKELLSILAEKYASYYLEGKGSTNIIKMINSIRFSVIKFYYKDRVEDIEFLRKKADKFNNPYAFRLYHEYKTYNKVIGEAYGLGFIYSEILFNLIINDNNFINELNQVFNKNTTIQELLDCYIINMKNKEVLEESKKQLRLVL